MTAEDQVRNRYAVDRDRLAAPPRDRSNLSPREIMCRACAGWTVRGDDGVWRHRDGSDACVQPDDLRRPLDS